MASPIIEGTLASTVFSSRDINILSERIAIKIDRDFNSAKYFIEYLIKTDTSGNQIPLLFHAQDYDTDFKIWVDGQEVKLKEIPKHYLRTSGSPFEKFQNSVHEPYHEGKSETVLIYWEENTGLNYYLSDLKYFELNIDSGEHRVEIEYLSQVWVDHSDWVKEYSFRYSLSPAKHWKSFGSLEIIVDATEYNNSLTSNFGEPNSGELDSISVWNFSDLPDEEFFQITYKPQIEPFAKFLTVLGPFKLMLIVGLLIILVHLMLIWKFRKHSPEKRYSWIVIVGSITLPFFILLCYMFAYDIIDNLIGIEAGGHHGYSFLMVIFYPILMPIYWYIMSGADRLFKMRIEKRAITQAKN